MQKKKETNYEKLKIFIYTLYLLDEQLYINGIGKVSENVIEKVVEIVPITDSFRKAEMAIKETTNIGISHEWIRKLIVEVGDKLTSKEIRKLRDARIYQQYDINSIKMRVTNGDEEQWTKEIAGKEGFYQKVQFHIMQEIVRDVPEEYRNILSELVNTKKYDKITSVIEGLKYKIGGEYKALEKL